MSAITASSTVLVPDPWHCIAACATSPGGRLSLACLASMHSGDLQASLRQWPCALPCYPWHVMLIVNSNLPCRPISTSHRHLTVRVRLFRALSGVSTFTTDPGASHRQAVVSETPHASTSLAPARVPISLSWGSCCVPRLTHPLDVTSLVEWRSASAQPLAYLNHQAPASRHPAASPVTMRNQTR